MSSGSNSTWQLIDACYFAVNRYLILRLHRAGFTDIRLAHAKVFEQIVIQPLTVTSLAEQAQITKQAMGELVVYLEQAGYVQRLPDPADRRAKLVSLTERGWSAARVAYQGLTELSDELERRIARDGLRRFEATLAEILALTQPAIDG